MKKSVYLSGLLVICCSLFSVIARAQAPVISIDPSNVTACNGSTIIFRIAAATATSFMWERSTDGGTLWDTVHNNAVYTGAANDTLTVITNTSLNGYKYRCRAFNTSGSDTSLNATLTVESALATTDISGPSSVCQTFFITLTAPIAGGTWSNVNHAIDTVAPTGIVEGRAAGIDTVKYTINNACGISVAKKVITVQTTPTALTITGPTHVCVGNFITLVNANAGGTWSVTNARATISSTGTLTGVSSGLDTVKYTFTNACSTVVSTKVITIETLPSAGTVTGTSAMCAGTWVHLTATATGGIWLSGAASVAVVNTVGDVTGVSAGTSAISYYQTNSCGAAIASLTVTVTGPAAAIGGPDSVGVGANITVTNTTPSGTWSSSNTAAGTIGSTGVITGIASGITTITYSVTNPCGTSYTTKSVLVGVTYASIIGGPDTVCVGSTITLTDTATGGFWDSKHDTLATINSVTGALTGVKRGLDTVYYTITDAFGTKTVMKKVYINGPPIITIAGPAAVAMGGGYQLTGTPAGGTWTQTNAGMAPLIGYGFFVVIDTGTAKFTYTTSNACGTSSKIFNVHLPGVNAVSTIGEGAAKFNVYPNPSNGAVTINITTSTTEEVSVALMDVTGRVVREFKVKTNNATDLMLDQSNGIYILSAITADGNRHTARISISN